MHKSLAAVIITYHPTGKVLENIKSYYDYTELLIVVDNTETENNFFLDKLRTFPKVVIKKNLTNEGIAKSLNYAANIALSRNYSWLLTMDQDSFFFKPDLDKYLNCLASLPDKETVAMAGLSYYGETQVSGCDYYSSLNLITSGSIVNLNLFQIIGGFDEALFIDEVDTDYCYNANSKGYQTIIFKNIFLNHSLGEAGYYMSLKTFKLTKRVLHSPLRLYYMVRNHFYINNKY